MKAIYIILFTTITLFAQNHTIDQKNKTFIPHEIYAKVGDTITFKNSDPFVHNAFTDNKKNLFDIGIQPPGEDRVIKIKAKGTFKVECAIHPNMLLEVHVK